MYKSKILVGFIILAYVLFIVFQFSGNTYMASRFSAFIFPLIALLYFITVKPKTLFFSLFLICYALSELAIFIIDYIPYDYFYYLGNFLSMFSYAFLLVEVCKSVCGIHILKHFKIHVIVLTGLNIYIAYILQEIVNPYVEMTNEYFVEITYNIVMLLLLSVSLLNYFYKDDKKSLFLFFGALCVVFSEVINVAYLYVQQQKLLNFMSVSLFLLAFYFFYQQSKLENEKIKEIIIEE